MSNTSSTQSAPGQTGANRQTAQHGAGQSQGKTAQHGGYHNATGQMQQQQGQTQQTAPGAGPKFTDWASI